MLVKATISKFKYLYLSPQGEISFGPREITARVTTETPQKHKIKTVKRQKVHLGYSKELCKL